MQIACFVSMTTMTTTQISLRWGSHNHDILRMEVLGLHLSLLYSLAGQADNSTTVMQPRHFHSTQELIAPDKQTTSPQIF